MTEQRAFAVVSPKGFIISQTIAHTAREARANVERRWASWAAFERTGWRIRPVVIRVEDEENAS